MASQQIKKSKQTTLLQTWGYEGNLSTSVQEENPFDDDDDDMLNEALEASMAQVNNHSAGMVKGPSFKQPDPVFGAGKNQSGKSPYLHNQQKSNVSHGSKLEMFQSPLSASASNTSLLDPSNFEELPPVPQSTPLENLPGFDVESGRTWIYPTNYPVRQYQFDIVKSCLFQNTLVTLPTGLGKTFIAAVVMYNFYRWYPQGRIIFMAPTKPLVAQQIEACFNVMGVPQSDMSEMTGNVAIGHRELAWKQKRIFFMTPQVMSNDLSRSLFCASHVKLLVVDEAHRAQGDYAYCQVIRELDKSNASYRVVALSATPGSDLNAVKLVLQNLKVSNIELRNEESPDIIPYTHQRTIQKVVVPIGDELKKVKMEYLSVLEPFVRRLAKMGLLSKKGNSIDPTQYSKFVILESKNEFSQNPPARLDLAQRGTAMGDFASAISLYHAYELLLQHGMRTFYNYFAKVTGDADLSNQGQTNNTSSATTIYKRRLRYYLNQNPVWMNLMATLKSKFSQDNENARLNSSAPQLWSQFNGSGLPSQQTGFVFGHPKLEKLMEMVVEHFRNKEKEKIATRVMIFSQYRGSVQEITACLHSFKPLIKVMEFVGQAGKGGLSQKMQIEVVRRFREGGYNTLVSTCVGEEGLDIGEVDLIVCYDVSKSPIRLVQRMGRTGRKRAGRIIVLLTEGKEELTYNQSMYSKNSINKAILEKQKLIPYFCQSPRMIPRGIEPVCHKMVMVEQNYVVGKSGSSSSGPKDQRISNMFMRNSVDSSVRAASFRDSKGFLNSSELQYWSENFKLDDEENVFKKVKMPKEVWHLSRKDVINQIAMGEDTSKVEYELSEWSLWQGSQQFQRFQTHGSKLYKDILDFIKVHRYQKKSATQIPNEDDDFGYAAEMAAWLNEGDINLRPGTTIDQFFARETSPVLSRSVRDSEQINTDQNEEEMYNFDDISDVEMLSPPKETPCCEPYSFVGEYEVKEFHLEDCPTFDASTIPLLNSIENFDHVTWWRLRTEKSSTKPNDNIDDEMLGSPPLSPVILTRSDFKQKPTSTPLALAKSFRRLETDLMTSPPTQPKKESCHSPSLLKSQGDTQGTLSPGFLEAVADEISDQLNGGRPDISGSKNACSSSQSPEVNQGISFSLSALKDEFDNDFESSHLEVSKCRHPNPTFDRSLYGTTQLLDFLDTTVTPKKASHPSKNVNSNLKPDVTDKSNQELTETSFKSHYNHSIEYSLDNLPPLMFSSKDISSEKDLFAEFDYYSETVVSDEQVRQEQFQIPESCSYRSFSYLNSIETEPCRKSEPLVKVCSFAETTNESQSIEKGQFKLPDLANFESRGRTPKKIKKTASEELTVETRKLPNDGNATMDFDSPIFVPKKRFGRQGSVFSSSDEEDTFPSMSNKEDQPLRMKKPKKKEMARRFLDTQANLSGEASLDESTSEDEKLEASFVDDDHQEVTTDQRAMYLRSLRSPHVARNIFKPRSKKMALEDVYSQMPNDSELMEDFETDSFVVGSSDVEYVSSLDELDLVDEFGSEDNKRKIKKRKKRRSSDDSKSSSPSPKRTLAKRRQRIYQQGSSSSEQDDIVILSQHKDDNKGMPSPPKPHDTMDSHGENSSLLSQILNKPTTFPKSNETLVVTDEPLAEVNKEAEKSLDTTLSFSFNHPNPTRRTILVGASDVHRAVELISDLKHKYNLDVVVRSGLNISFLLSPRMGVHRLSAKDFSNGALKSQLIDQCQKMNDLFERPCLLIETEKPADPEIQICFAGGFVERHGGIHRTKYMDTILAQLSQSKFQVLYSSSQSESAQILAALASKEARKGYSLPFPLRLTPTAEKVLPFYRSLPGVSFGTALQLASQFNSVKSCVGAAQATLMRKAGLDEKKASAVKQFFRRKLSPDI